MCEMILTLQYDSVSLGFFSLYCPSYWSDIGLRLLLYYYYQRIIKLLPGNTFLHIVLWYIYQVLDGNISLYKCKQYSRLYIQIQQELPL